MPWKCWRSLTWRTSLLIKGSISIPVRANPVKWLSKHCISKHPSALWHLRTVFGTKPRLFPFANVLCADGCLCLHAQPCEYICAVCRGEIWNLRPVLRVNRQLSRRLCFRAILIMSCTSFKSGQCVQPYLAVHAPSTISIRLSANTNPLLLQLAGNIK